MNGTESGARRRFQTLYGACFFAAAAGSFGCANEVRTESDAGSGLDASAADHPGFMEAGWPPPRVPAGEAPGEWAIIRIDGESGPSFLFGGDPLVYSPSETKTNRLWVSGQGSEGEVLTIVLSQTSDWPPDSSFELTARPGPNGVGRNLFFDDGEREWTSTSGRVFDLELVPERAIAQGRFEAELLALDDFTTTRALEGEFRSGVGFRCFAEEDGGLSVDRAFERPFCRQFAPYSAVYER
jgi:hypothetical protein